MLTGHSCCLRWSRERGTDSGGLQGPAGAEQEVNEGVKRYGCIKGLAELLEPYGCLVLQLQYNQGSNLVVTKPACSPPLFSLARLTRVPDLCRACVRARLTRPRCTLPVCARLTRPNLCPACIRARLTHPNCTLPVCARLTPPTCALPVFAQDPTRPTCAVPLLVQDLHPQPVPWLYWRKARTPDLCPACAYMQPRC